MTLRASRSTMVAVAAGWEGIADELERARGRLVACRGHGKAFGWFAERADIDKDHETFNEAMIAALSSGSARARQIADALRATAKDFGATDLDVADGFHTLTGQPRRI